MSETMDKEICKELELQLGHQLNTIALYNSVRVMKDDKLLVVRINNSSTSDRYIDDYVSCAKIVKSVVTKLLPDYSPWLEFDHGTPKEFIVFIFTCKGD